MDGNSLSFLDAKVLTGDLILTNTGFSAQGGTIMLGAGNNRLTLGSMPGPDMIFLGSGADTLIYITTAQSSPLAMDTISGFVSGTDILNITALAAYPHSYFVGNHATFALAQGALITANGQTSIVYQQDANILWIDIDADGTLSNLDWCAKFSGVSTINSANFRSSSTP